MERNDPWGRVVAAAGAIGAAVALLYVIGAASLSLRYEGFGLPGQQAAALTPREVLLAAGLRTIVIWAALGLALVFALRALPDATVREFALRLRKPSGVLAVTAVALVLLLVLNVWWPLAAFGALLSIIFASVHWKSRPLPRLIVGVLSIALVAVAYEADRLAYILEWTCVAVARTADPNQNDPVAGSSPPVQAGQTTCGALIAQQDRGFYLGVPSTADAATGEAGPYRLAFIPGTRVEYAYSQRQLTRVIASRAEVRREPLLSRLWNIQVR